MKMFRWNQKTKKDIPVLEMICDVESIAHAFFDDQNDRNVFRSRAVNILTNNLKPGNSNSIFQNHVRNMYKRTKSFLRNHNENNSSRKICVIPSDKGNQSCIIYEDLYK